MKFLALAFLISLAAISTFAQTGQPRNVQMQCRQLINDENNFLRPNETYVNGMACHPVKAQAALVAIGKTANSTSTVESAVPAPAIVPAPNTVYITPMDGFDTYLAAAFVKKQVPLTVVGDEAHAAYVIRGTSDEKKAGWAKMAFMGDIHSDDAASIQMIDRKTDAVIFAYAVNKKNTWHGQQTTAEACAKHLKEQLEKKSKQK